MATRHAPDDPAERRAHPPIVIASLDGLKASWPPTEADDWCGEYSPAQ